MKTKLILAMILIAIMMVFLPNIPTPADDITAVTIPNDNGTGSITVNLPTGVSLPVGFNAGGAFIFILIALTALVKRYPKIKENLDKLVPKTKDAAVILLVCVSGFLAGGVSILLNKYLGVPTPIDSKQLVTSILGLVTFAIGTHSVIIKAIWQGFLKSIIQTWLDKIKI